MKYLSKRIISFVMAALMLITMQPIQTNASNFSISSSENSVNKANKKINNTSTKKVLNESNINDNSLTLDTNETKDEYDSSDDEIEFESPEKLIIDTNATITKDYSYTKDYTGTYIECPGPPSSDIPSGAEVKWTGYGTNAPKVIYVGRWVFEYLIVQNYTVLQKGNITLNVVRYISYNKSNYSGTYDGNSHTGSVSVVEPSSGSSITYATSSGGTYSGTKPTRTDVGTTTVYFKIIASEYTETTGSFTITINKANMTVSKSNYSGTYDGNAHTGSVSVTKPTSGATIKYGTTSGTYNLSSAPTRTDVGTQTVYYKVTASNYNDSIGSFTITINKANSEDDIELLPSLPEKAILQTSASWGSNCVTFYSATDFAITKKANLQFDGQLQYCWGDPTSAGWGITSGSGVADTITTVKIDGVYAVSLRSPNCTYFRSSINGVSGLSFSGSNIYCVGYIETLLKYNNPIAPTTSDNTFKNLFAGCTNLIKAADFKMISGLRPYCYYQMYYNTGLTVCPDMPANSVPDYGYCGTFQNCYSLRIPMTTVPAITVGEYGCYAMFQGCSTLLRPPSMLVKTCTGENALWALCFGCSQLRVYKSATTYDGKSYSRAWKLSVTSPSVNWNAQIFDGTPTSDIVKHPENDVTYYVLADGYAPITVDTSAAANAIAYDGKEKSIPVTVTNPKLNNTVKYSTDNSNWSTTPPTRTVVGTTKIYYKVTNSNAAYKEATGTYNLVIKNADMTVTASNYEGTYDGKNHSGSVSAPSGATITYSESATGTFSGTNPSYINAGTKTVYYKVTKQNYNDVSSSFTVTINKANMTTSAGDVDVTYDGNPHSSTVSVTKVVSTDTHTIEYSVDGGAYTTTLPTYTDVCNHTIDYRVKSSNYNDSTGKYTIKIKPKAIEATITPYTGTYDGNKHTGSISVTTPDPGAATITYATSATGTYTSTIPEFDQAGTHPVYYKINATNYVEKTGNFLVTINKAKIVSSASNVDVTYNGSEYSSTINVSKVVPTDPHVIKYSVDGGEYTDQVPKYSDACNHTIKYKITSANYIDFDGEYTFKIAKAKIQAVVESIDVTYDGKPHSSTISVYKVVETDPHAIEYSVDEGPYTTTVPSYTNACDHIIAFRITSPNYETFDGSYSIKITKAKITASANDIEVMYDGNPHSGTVEINTPIVDVTTTYSSSYTGTYTTRNPSYTNPGTYVVYYKVTDPSGNYDEFEGSFTIIIIGFIQASAQNVNVSYDGLPHTGTVKVEQPKSGYTIYYSLDESHFTTSNIEFVNVNKKAQTVYYKIEASKFVTYTGTFTVKINKVQPAARAEDVEVAYDGQLHYGNVQITYPAHAAEYKIYYRLDEGTQWSESNLGFSEKGTYKVLYKIQGDNYYTLTSSFTIFISDGISATATDIYTTYDGKEHYGQANVTFPDKGTTTTYATNEGGAYSASIPKFVNAGTYTVFYKVQAAGYVSKTGSFTIDIAKADMVIKSPDIEVPYDGKSHIATLTPITPSTGVNITYSRTEDGEYTSTPFSFKDTGKYPVYYRVTDTKNNYNDYAGSFKVKILGQIEASATGLDIQYDGLPHTGTVTVTRPTEDYTISYSTDGKTYSTTNPEFIEATKKAVIVNYKVESDGFVTATGSFTVKIGKVQIVARADDIRVPFDNKPHSSQVEVIRPEFASNYTISYRLNSETTWSQTCPSYTEIGTYNVIYKIEGPSYYTLSSSFVIDILDAISLNVDDLNVVYDGKEHFIEAKAIYPAKGVTITYATSEEGEYSENIPKYTNAGEYKVYYLAKAKNYDNVSGSFTINIAKADIEVNAKDLLYRYNGDPREVPVEVLNPTDNANVQYSINGGEYATNIPCLTEIGEYIIDFKITADNYNDFEGTYKVTIYDFLNFDAYASDVEAVYDGNAYNSEVIINNPPEKYTIKYKTSEEGEYKEVNPTFTNAGEYTVYYLITAEDYRNFEGSYKVTINKDNMQVEAEDVTYKYDGKAKIAPINVLIPTENYKITYSTDGENYTTEYPEFIEPFEYTLHYRITSDNYNEYNGVVLITIKDLERIIAHANDVVVDYDGLSHSGKVNVDYPMQHYLITYATTATGTYTQEMPTFTNAGEYTVFYEIKAEDFRNFKGSFTVTINKINMKVVANNGAYKYDGEPKDVEVIVVHPIKGYTISYTQDGETYVDEAPSFKEIGEYTVSFNIVADNYNDYTGFVTITINNLDEIKANTQDTICVYDGLTHTSEITVEAPTDDYMISYSENGESYSTIQPTYTNVGDYLVYYKITAPGYNPLEGVYSVMISPATIEVVANDVQAVFNNTDHFVDISIKNEINTDPIITYSLDDETYSQDKPVCRDAGTYVIYYHIEASNYKTLKGSYNIVVQKANLVAMAENVKVEYDGNSHTGFVELQTNVEGAVITYSKDNITFDTEAPEFTEAGEHTVYYKIEAEGYNVLLGNFSVIIINTGEVELVESVPIYIMYNPNSGEHLFTSKLGEYNKLEKVGWKKEGIAFYAYTQPVEEGTPIYRVFNPNAPGGDHHYTKSVSEVNKLVGVGWRKDNKGEPVFYAKGDVVVYKLYNKGNGRHHYTQKKRENDKLVQIGWIGEGIAWYAAKLGESAEATKS